MVKKQMKRAEITVETVLAIALSTIVLFLILNLFGGNIQKVVQNSNIYRMIYKNNADTKTAYKKWDTDPTKTQANIQIVADQADLASLHNNAATAINGYITKSETTTLNNNDLMNLALQLTIFAESGTSNQNPLNLLTGTTYGTRSISYYNFGRKYDITVSTTNPITGNTQISGKNLTIKWGNQPKGSNGDVYNPSAIYNYQTQSSDSDRVKNIDGIKSCFQDQYKL